MSSEFKPASYRPDQFVDREDELRLVRAKVEQACRSEPIDRPIVHIHSIPRGGKTWLLQHLAHLYIPGSNLVGVMKDIAVVAVDCGIVVSAPDWRAALLQMFKMPFAEKIDTWCGKLNGIGTLSDLPKSLRGFGAGCMALFLFDAADAFSEKDFEWLEEFLLEPLACTNCAVVVLAGRADAPRWRRVETRRRLHDLSLRAFSADETAEQGRRRDFTGSGQELYRYAQGYPYLAQLLSEIPAPLDDAKASEVLQHVEAELLRHIPLEKRRVVRILAVLRQFDLGILRELLREMYWAEYAARSDAFFLQKSLQETVDDPDWLLWDRQSGSYRLAPIVRGVLLQQLRLIDPGLYEQSHRAAFELYKRWLQRYPHNCGKFLREAIYHRTALGAIVPVSETDFDTGLIRLVKSYLIPESFSADQAIALEHALKEDQTLPEKQPCVSYYEAIRRQLRHFAERAGHR